MHDTAQLIAVILLAAFGIERIVVAVTFWLEPIPADDARKNKQRKLLLSALAGALALAFVDYGSIRILERLQPRQITPTLDYWLTWLVVFAGSDRVKEFLGSGGGGAAKEPKKEVPPIKIVVDEGLSVHRVA